MNAKRRCHSFFAAVLVLVCLPVSRPAIAQTDPAEIIEKSLQAQGGREALENVKDKLLAGTFMSSNPQGNVLAEFKSFFKYGPKKYRSEILVAGIEIITGFDGENVWTKRFGKLSSVPQTMAEEIKSSSDRDDILLTYKKKGYKVEYRGINPIGEQPCHKVDLIDREGRPVSYYLHSQTLLPVKVEYNTVNESGQPVLNEEFYSDYRRVDNLMCAFRSLVLVNGQKIMNRTILEVKINRGLDDGLFKTPEK